MAETPRHVQVLVTADLTQFEAGMRKAAEITRRAGRRLKVAPAPWQPWSWYATSERAS